MRHDLAAFRELDTLVRNLSNRLADYRRRALLAESRLRELEQTADEFRAAAAKGHDRAEVLASELETANEALRVARDASATADALVNRLSQAAADAARLDEGTQSTQSERALARDNAELRRRLEDASARTRELSDRLRFLRQQLATVPDK
ncbi:MAG: hypothetical protein M3Y64_00470 [Gemmatimonadota bacterium]|nr:hypothetical protein [Gemmatimonadota bacterium]